MLEHVETIQIGGLVIGPQDAARLLQHMALHSTSFSLPPLFFFCNSPSIFNIIQPQLHMKRSFSVAVV